ncbi:unnamed protein product [Blumeria hordei]|uniref:Transmembrane protein n=1 Tax=Blumeria hordei TaxID=2867405 RepID=A0A383UI79_BLUHO|nr:unnamed protein product [Blumeria hordei]
MNFSITASQTRTWVEYLKDRSTIIPLIIAFYVIVLGSFLMSALNRQKFQIELAKKDRNPMFSMLDEDDDDENGKDS